MGNDHRTDAARITGVPDLTYDLVAMLHEKLGAIAVYEGYLQDALNVENHEAVELISSCQAADRAAIDSLRILLSRELAGFTVDSGLGRAPVHPNRGGDLRVDVKDDPIDDASDDSFPASDPPAFTGAHAG